MFKPSLSAFLLLSVLAGTAAAQERQWNLDATDEDAYLVFGVPETDDVGLSIWCAIQSDRAKIFLPEASTSLKPGTRAPMYLTAGKTVMKLRGETAENADSDAVSLEAETDVSNPIFTAMLSADRLTVTVAGEEKIFPLIDANVESLLRLCAKPAE